MIVWLIRFLKMEILTWEMPKRIWRDFLKTAHLFFDTRCYYQYQKRAKIKVRSTGVP